MGISNSGRSVVIIVLSFNYLISSGGQELDSCTSERNCSIQSQRRSNNDNIKTTRLRNLLCSSECERVNLAETAAVHGTQKLYPYLATIAIYKRFYDDLDIDAFNFSFVVPQSEISDKGILGVMARFREAPGYKNNSYYKEPICRVFNFSRSPRHLLDTFGAQEIPYSCIGINIYPSVFHLHLMSVPSSHALDYVVSWHEHSFGEYEYFYKEELDHVNGKSVWVEQLIAVAAVKSQRLIHAVFQPARSNAGVESFKVSLVQKFHTIISKQVEPNFTSVTFNDVTPGQYRVVVQPQGGICDIDLTVCAEIASEHVNMDQHHDTTIDDSTNDGLAVVVSVCVVVVILIFFGIVILLIIKRHWKKGELESSEICVTSLACRELEELVTSYFCSFLSIALHTRVTFMLPLLHPEKIQTVNVCEATKEVEMQQTLLLKSSRLENVPSCCIVLQFSYSDGHCQKDNVQGKQGDKLSEKSFYLKKYNLTDVNVGNTIRGIRSKHYFVTFKQESISPDTGIAYTIHEGSVNSVNSEDKITVLNGVFRKPSHTDNISKTINSSTNRVYNQHVKEYCLPCDIHDLYEDLRSCLRSRTEYMSNCAISEIESWHLAVTVFRKATEQAPEHTTLCNTHGHEFDARTLTEAKSEVDYIQSYQETSRLYDNQFQMCHLNNSFIIPPRAPENLFSNSTSSEAVKLNEMLKGGKHYTMLKTPLVQKRKFLESNAITRHGSFSSCDSYSNLTEAEIDFKYQCSVQLRQEIESVGKLLQPTFIREMTPDRLID